MEAVPNYIVGNWIESQATEFVEVVNPATGGKLARTPLSPAAEVNLAADTAAAALPK